MESWVDDVVGGCRWCVHEREYDRVREDVREREMLDVSDLP